MRSLKISHKVKVIGRLHGGETGGSLPGVLIAIAVGAVLLGAFLSHVSTRMLSVGAVENRLEEEYSVDSAVEFASWKLLNDSAFQSTVDAAYPNPVAVTPAITVNGLTPSITAAAVNQRGWSSRAATPDSVNMGGDLTYGGGRFYALEWQGAVNMSFWSYNPSTDNWSTITNGPAGAKIKDGAGIVYADGKLYTILGNKSDQFWAYTIGGSWDQKDDLPDEAGVGSDMVVVLNYIYALQGGKGQGEKGFWRYSISGDSWETRSSTPDNVSDGGSLAYAGGNYIYALAGGDTADFWQYDLFSDNWSSLPSPPGNVEDGAGLNYTGDDTLHALQGGGSTALWSYDISTQNWSVLDPAPGGVSRGGSLAWDQDEFIYALRGNNTRDFWRFLAAPPKYDLTSQAGSTTLLSRIQVDQPQADILWWDFQ